MNDNVEDRQGGEEAGEGRPPPQVHVVNDDDDEDSRISSRSTTKMNADDVKVMKLFDQVIGGKQQQQRQRQGQGSESATPSHPAATAATTLSLTKKELDRMMSMIDYTGVSRPHDRHNDDGDEQYPSPPRYGFHALQVAARCNHTIDTLALTGANPHHDALLRGCLCLLPNLKAIQCDDCHLLMLSRIIKDTRDRVREIRLQFARPTLRMVRRQEWRGYITDPPPPINDEECSQMMLLPNDEPTREEICRNFSRLHPSLKVLTVKQTNDTFRYPGFGMEDMADRDPESFVLRAAVNSVRRLDELTLSIVVYCPGWGSTMNKLEYDPISKAMVFECGGSSGYHPVVQSYIEGLKVAPGHSLLELELVDSTEDRFRTMNDDFNLQKLQKLIIDGNCRSFDRTFDTRILESVTQVVTSGSSLTLLHMKSVDWSHYDRGSAAHAAAADRFVDAIGDSKSLVDVLIRSAIGRMNHLPHAMARSRSIQKLAIHVDEDEFYDSNTDERRDDVQQLQLMAATITALHNHPTLQYLTVVAGVDDDYHVILRKPLSTFYDPRQR